MFSTAFNLAKARRWQEKRKRIRAASGAQKLRLLRSFGEEIRALAPTFTRVATVEKQDIASALEVSSAFGAILGGWLNLDPTNPLWPGRDRLFVIRRDDLINACAALSVCGFFPPEEVPELVEAVDARGSAAAVPGIESPGVPADELPRLVWESATESARDKKRWRDALGSGMRDMWFSPGWSDAPETWRTCVVLDVADPVTARCRDLLRRRDEVPAGLVALVKAPEGAAHGVAEDWGSAGWEAVLVDKGDLVRMHDVLSGAKPGVPLAIVLSTSTESEALPHISRTIVRRRESGLLGEMSDEQFNALMDESLRT